ncbi:MAG: hypothetical protein IKL24_05015 [Clostridia bacterium]|nr:hypothetical protein [Clostridia bacterium]
MKKTLKTVLMSFAVLVALCAVCVCAFPAAAQSTDPADSYVKQTAPYED